MNMIEAIVVIQRCAETVEEKLPDHMRFDFERLQKQTTELELLIRSRGFDQYLSFDDEAKPKILRGPFKDESTDPEPCI